MAPKPIAREKLDAVGIDAICARIEAGETMGEIAASIGVDRSTLSLYLSKDDNVHLSARARLSSAEAWLDRGLEAVASAMDKSGGIDASAARAYAQECARRAALRNPRYIEKTAHEVTGADGGAIETRMIVEYIKPPVRE